MHKQFIVVFVLLCLALVQSCEKEEVVFGDRQQFFGTWAYEYDYSAIRENGEVVSQFQETGSRFTFREDNTVINDRGFWRDTSTWYYVADPPTIILSYGLVEDSRVFGRVLEVVNFSEESFELYERLRFQDSLGWVNVTAHWTLLN